MARQPRGLPAEPLAQYIERIYPDCHYGIRKGESKSRHHEGHVPEFLAELTGLHRRTVYRILCREQERIDIDTIDKVCCALSIHAVQLYGKAWTHKVCAMCGEEKLLDEFYVNSTRCIACASIAARERSRLYREDNREKINARKREAQQKAVQVIA